MKMKKISKKVELMLLEPMYSTYHYQTPSAAFIMNNPSIRNWTLTEVMILACTVRFLDGYTTPQLDVVKSFWDDNPNFKKKWYDMYFLNGYTNIIIKNLVDAGYYVYFTDIDDYYVRGKSWYNKRHFTHDGCVCGYDDEAKTFCIYAYDENWIYRKFWTPQKDFNKGRVAEFKKDNQGIICGIKPKEDKIEFNPQRALANIEIYLKNTPVPFRKGDSNTRYGIVVHDYISKYLDKLYDGSIPYEKLDWRIFRLIWEHKKVMLERIEMIEKHLQMDNTISNAYKTVVRDADNCRMLYASYHMKQRNSILPTIQSKLLSLKTQEEMLLTELIKKSKGEF